MILFSSVEDLATSLKNTGSGKLLDVQWGQTARGTPVWIWEYNGNGAQRWQIINVPWTNR